MTPSLRRAHRLAWYGLAVLLPAGWLVALRAIPDVPGQSPFRPSPPPPMPLVVATRSAGPYLINLRRDSTGGSRQVEIAITRPQTSAGTHVYAVGAGGETLLGALHTRGLYRFALGPAARPPVQLRFIDPVKRRVLREVTLDEPPVLPHQ